MIAPPNINWGMDASALAAVLANSSAEPGMLSERMSAFNMLIMTTIHRVERRTFVSIFFVGTVIAFIFFPVLCGGISCTRQALLSRSPITGH